MDEEAVPMNQLNCEFHTFHNVISDGFLLCNIVDTHLHPSHLIESDDEVDDGACIPK